MQREEAGARLNDAQAALATRGLKALIPIGGRPFLDHVMSAVADAGVRDICLVVGPGEHPVRQYYEPIQPARIRLSFAVQEEPMGAAHALLAAEPFAAGDDVLVLNADNYYPTAAVRALGAVQGSALAGFRSDVLVRGNIPRSRLAAYAIATADEAGHLMDIIEKPGAAVLARYEREQGSWISMTCWRFRANIFDACRAVAPSVRGEYELPDAVRHAVHTLGEVFRVVPVAEPVLDLTGRADIEAVTHWLREHAVRL